MRNDSIELPAGTILQKRYKILKVLGAGGFGITYEAEDLINQISCAIKEFAPMDIAVRAENQLNLKPVSIDKQEIYEHGKKRFVEEAEILKRLQNIPAVVSITDYFDANGTSYFVMEYLDGVTLKVLVRKMGGKIPLQQALPVLYETALALQKVHESSNIFHRDISPENIIITRQGNAKLIDFGNAKYIMQNGKQVFSVVLKPGFAPYEQYSTKGKQGSYTDVYSLAGTFYYVLSGHMIPYAPERVAGTGYVRLKDMAIGIPDYISDAFDRAMAIKYRERTQTMRDFLEDLQLLKKEADISQISTISASKENTVRQPYLDVIHQTGKTQRYILPANEAVMVGRSPFQASIVLDGDAYISKRQFEVFFDSIDNAFYIQDHSSNGTFMNGTRLEKEKIYVWRENQLCTVGNQVLYLRIGII